MRRMPRSPRGGRPQTARAEWKRSLHEMPRELSRDAPVRDCPGSDDEASPGCPEGRERSFLPCMPPAPPVFQRPASREEHPGSLPRLPSGTIAMDERRPDIWIVRHGETDWSRRGLHTGRTDTPLTAAGEREAIALRRRFGGRSFARVL